jgi:hypothetical protein
VFAVSVPVLCHELLPKSNATALPATVPFATTSDERVPEEEPPGPWQLRAPPDAVPEKFDPDCVIESVTPLRLQVTPAAFPEPVKLAA